MAAAGGGATSMWWDMGSCPLPSYVDPYIVVSMAPAILRNFNIVTSSSMVNAGEQTLHDHRFSAYDFVSETQTELHQTLMNSGIGLQELPPGKSNELEKMMMADVLLWAMDTPPPANIIFIIGSVDFCYLFQKLRQRSYNVFLVCQSMTEMPPGMLGGVNYCLGWLSFLRSLQNEDQHLHFPGGINVYDHSLSNTAFPTSSTSFQSTEMEESSSVSGFINSQENLFSMKPSLSDERDSTCNFLPSLGDGWDSTCNFPLDETASSPVQPEPCFRGHKIRTRKPRKTKPSSPVSSASSTAEKKLASLVEFKAWLTRVLNGKKHANEGYNVSPIHEHFEQATGKILDEKVLGFSKMINLLEDCKDIAVIKEIRRGCHVAFPVKPNEQKKSPNQNEQQKKKSNPKAESKSSAFPVKPNEQKKSPNQNEQQKKKSKPKDKSKSRATGEICT